MWRCKWTELRIKEIGSQALKCTREIGAYDLEKLSEFNKSSLEDLGSKSLPFANQFLKRKILMRKRRKRIEDAMDVTSFMKQHNLFAYFGISFSVFLDADNIFPMVGPMFQVLLSFGFQKTENPIQTARILLMILLTKVPFLFTCFCRMHDTVKVGPFNRI